MTKIITIVLLLIGCLAALLGIAAFILYFVYKDRFTKCCQLIHTYENYITTDDGLLVNKSNIHKYLTIGIKTFLRPHCLQECITSILKYYPNISIYIADDSTDDVKLLNKKVIDDFDKSDGTSPSIKLFDLPYDSGLSTGRNFLVSKTQTPYFLVLDDSRYLSNKVNLIAMLNFLITSGYDLIAGVCNDRKTVSNTENAHYSKKYISERIDSDGIPIVKTQKIHKKPIDNKYLKAYDSNQTLNIFIAKTEKLKASPWNNNLKVGEHELFFYNWWKNNYRCAVSYDINFSQSKKRHYLKGGETMRERAYAGNKYDIKKHIRFE